MTSLRLRVKGPTGEQRVITADANESVKDFSVRMKELFKTRADVDILTGFPPRPVSREVGGMHYRYNSIHIIHYNYNTLD